VRPVVLAANQPPKFYRGGRRISEFRHLPVTDQHGPPYGSEDWLGSTVSNYGTEVGATRLTDGRLLRDAIAADPVGYLGAEHVAALGANSGLLLKLLDAGERLPVHCHPSRAFARTHLDSVFGKTEAWIVLATDGDEGFVYLGFRDDVSDRQLESWFTQQPTDILAAMNRVSVRAGDAVLVQAGMPHANRFLGDARVAGIRARLAGRITARHGWARSVGVHGQVGLVEFRTRGQLHPSRRRSPRRERERLP
jgi:mannose-6-phosphate isomerase